MVLADAFHAGAGFGGGGHAGLRHPAVDAGGFRPATGVFLHGGGAERGAREPHVGLGRRGFFLQEGIDDDDDEQPPVEPDRFMFPDDTEFIVLNGSTADGWKIERWGNYVVPAVGEPTIVEVEPDDTDPA